MVESNNLPKRLSELSRQIVSLGVADALAISDAKTRLFRLETALWKIANTEETNRRTAIQMRQAAREAIGQTIEPEES